MAYANSVRRIHERPRNHSAAWRDKASCPQAGPSKSHNGPRMVGARPHPTAAPRYRTRHSGHPIIPRETGMTGQSSEHRDDALFEMHRRLAANELAFATAKYADAKATRIFLQKIRSKDRR